MVYRPEWYRKQKYCQIPITIPIEKYEILMIDTQTVSKKKLYLSNCGVYHPLDKKVTINWPSATNLQPTLRLEGTESYLREM